MNINKHLKYIWVVFDSVLISAIFILMGAIVAVPRLDSMKMESDIEQETVSVQPDYSRPRNKSIKVEPVAYEREKVAQIARNMVVSESVEVPIRPALDMREKNEVYEVRFALPHGTVDEDVDVKVTDNILTLIMKSQNTALMRRIRIPCDYAHNAQLNHFVSNQVLYVEISNPVKPDND